MNFIVTTWYVAIRPRSGVGLLSQPTESFCRVTDSVLSRPAESPWWVVLGGGRPIESPIVVH